MGVKEDEEIDSAVAAILVIEALGPSGRGWDRLARFADELGGVFVEADHRPLRVRLLGVEIEHILHAGDVLGVDLGDAPHVLLPGLEMVLGQASADLANLDIQVITVPALRLDLEVDRRNLAETVDRLRPRLLILDPFVRLHRIDENASGEVAPLLAYLRELQRRYGVAVLVVHHARKGGACVRAGQALRGSSEFHAWGDSNLYLRRDGEELTLTVEHRAAPSSRPLVIELAQNGPALALEPASGPSPSPSRLPRSMSASRRRSPKHKSRFRSPTCAPDAASGPAPSTSASACSPPLAASSRPSTATVSQTADRRSVPSSRSPHLYSAWEWERERPAAKRPSLHPPNFPGSAPAVRVSLFPCSAGRPFPRPGLRSGTGVARRGGQGRAQARPTGLVLDGPEHGARLGRSRDAEGSLGVVVGEAVRTQEHGAGSYPDIRDPDLRPGEMRAQAARRQLQALSVPVDRVVRASKNTSLHELRNHVTPCASDLPGHVLTAASTTARSTGTGPSSALSAPPIKHRDCRALKHRERAYRATRRWRDQQNGGQRVAKKH